MNMVHDIATALSLSLTITTVLGCLGVLYLWRESAWNAWKRSHKKEIDWFVLGVAIGFLGALVDNIYWAIGWTADFLQLHSTRDFFFENGVYPNVFFRQFLTSAAAACHVRAAVASESLVFRFVVLGGWAAGLLVLGPLLYAGHVYGAF